MPKDHWKKTRDEHLARRGRKGDPLVTHGHVSLSPEEQELCDVLKLVTTQYGIQSTRSMRDDPSSTFPEQLKLTVNLYTDSTDPVSKTTRENLEQTLSKHGIAYKKVTFDSPPLASYRTTEFITIEPPEFAKLFEKARKPLETIREELKQLKKNAGAQSTSQLRVNEWTDFNFSMLMPPMTLSGLDWSEPKKGRGR